MTSKKSLESSELVMRTTLSRNKNVWLCWLSVVVVMLVIAMPRESRADPPHYRIDFAAPKHSPHCNDPEGFRGVLALALSRDVLEPPVSRVLDVRVDKPNGGDYVVDIALRELDGRVITALRETHPGSMECFKVLHFAALTAALEIDKDVPIVDKPATSPCSACAKPPPCPPCPSCPPCELPHAPPPKPLRHWFVGAGVRIDFGVAPDQLVGGHFVAGWRGLPRWSFEAHGRATLPKDTRPLTTTVVRVRSVGSVEFVPCYRIEPFGFCGELVLGNIWFTPLNLRYPRIDTALFWGVGIRAFVEQRLSDRLSMRVDAEVFTPVSRARIEDATSDDRWETSLVSGSASASLFVWF